MAKRGTVKATSLIQENFVANEYGGTRSPSSGASDTDKGDVRHDKYLIECKVTGSSAHPLDPDRIPKIIQDMEKATKEAYAEGLEPILALRWYYPGHYLADNEGWIDFAVHLLEEDAYVHRVS